MHPSLFSILIAMPVLAAFPSFAGFEEGEAAYRAGDYISAYKEWTSAARDGDARAQYALGDLYRRGKGVGANAALAAEWIRKAARAGHRPARTALGELHLAGHGVRRDLASAWAWFRLAAAAGDQWAGNQANRAWSGMTKWQREEAVSMLERLRALR